MIFPFSVRFNESLKINITSDNQKYILEYIKRSVLDGKADNVNIGDMQVTYKGSTSPWRGSLYRGVDDGVFTLINKNSKWMLNYQINMRKLFIATGIMSAIMGVFSIINGGPWWIGIAAFLWLCGMNWIINLVRHGGVAVEIAEGIDVIG